MASACVNTIPTTTTTTATSYTTFGWLSPRLSLTKEQPPSSDFEFRLCGDHNNTNSNDTMISADVLFSDGKLVPLQFSAPKTTSQPPLEKPGCKPVSEDPYLFSPKAPRCSSRWRDLFGLKKQNQNQQPPSKTTSSSKSMRLFLNRNAKTTSYSSVDSSLNSPLLKESCSSSSSMESISITSSRLSLSSSSSSHEHDELPRASLDSEKHIRPGPKVRTRPRMRKESRARGVSVDSPRMNPSGKVVFQSLERSSSSPSSFNGGPRNYKQYNKGGVMERSYSGNVHVRVTPVLNVPVCSLSKSGVFGFGHLFSSHSQKKEGSKTQNQNHHNNKDKEKEKESG